MLAVIRDDTGSSSYYITRSSDYGRTWDAVTQPGYFPNPYPTPAYLFRTNDDYLILAYTDTSPISGYTRVTMKGCTGTTKASS